MTFSKYIENVKPYYRNNEHNFNVLCLLSDTTKLIEKLKYFKNENSLIISDIGDLFFRLFNLLDNFKISIDEDPLNLEAHKVDIFNLSKSFDINEEQLIQNFVFEVGVISNVLTENIKHGVKELNEHDLMRIKHSIYSYVLQLMIIVSRHNFAINDILLINCDRKKVKNLHQRKV